MGIVDLMNISISSLRAQQLAMEVTAHNVANMNTRGYSRESALLSTQTPLKSGTIYRGMGVDFTNIRRAEDQFLNRNLFFGRMENGFQSAMSGSMAEVDDIFNETGENTGISDSLSSFWNAWSDLAGNPEGSAERANLTGLSQVLASRFHSTASRLELTQANLNSEVKQLTTDVNGMLSQIAALNAKIANAVHGGADPNDYRTQRNVLLEDLAEKLNYSYFENEDGAVYVSVGNGQALVEGSYYSSLDVRANPANDDLYDVIAVSANGKEANVTGDISGGELGGVLQVRDHEIPDAISRLDELAFTLINQVNAQHAAGTTLNGTTGVNFFTPLATADRAAELIEVDAGIIGDTNNIAAGLSADAGDNRNANLIAAIQDLKVMSGGTATLQEHYSTTIGNVGIATENAKQQLQQSDTIVSQLETYRETTTGVSIEEEMANLIKYQQAYQAAARVLNAASDIVTVLNELKQ